MANLLQAIVDACANTATQIKEYINNVAMKESDPTVPAWAKAETKPAYTAEEVGALPHDTLIPKIPEGLSAFTDDVGYSFAENFSETPQLTGGTWFDGKPIWRVSKHYSNVAFAGVGQWTDVGDLPIDITAAEYNVLNIDIELFYAALVSGGRRIGSTKLPLLYNGGLLSSPWTTDNALAFNWASGTTKPFDSCDVLVVIHFTRNDTE